MKTQAGSFGSSDGPIRGRRGIRSDAQRPIRSTPRLFRSVSTIPSHLDFRASADPSGPRLSRSSRPAGLVRLIERMEELVVGQRPLLERLVIALLAGGHVLIEGVPGLAKTRAVRALAQALYLPFRRIQFTPDLLPADLTGTQIYRPATGTFDVRPGPIVTSVLLADEINRAPAKVQSALLEAMQEGQITVGDETIALPGHFLGAGDPEPDRARGNVPASGGPARPVPDEAGRGLPRSQRRAQDARPSQRFRHPSPRLGYQNQRGAPAFRPDGRRGVPCAGCFDQDRDLP